jgi:vacuolar protein sorting-associated protein 45
MATLSDACARAGDLGVAIKGMVDEFQAASKSNQKIATIADMQRFVENYPEFRAKSGNVSKHVTLMGEMSRLIDERHLMQVSQVEQARPNCDVLLSCL